MKLQLSRTRLRFPFDSVRRRLKAAEESEKSLGSWRALMLTRNMSCHDSVKKLLSRWGGQEPFIHKLS